MKGRYRVLLTDGAYKHTLGAVRSLARAGFIADIIGDPTCISGYSRYTSRIAFPQKLFVNESISDFVSFLEKSQYDVILPVGAKSVQLLSTSRHLVSTNVKIPLAPQFAIELCLDKLRTIDYAKKVGVRVPTTWTFESLEDLQDHLNDLKFPVVVKSSSELSKSQPMYAFDEGQLISNLRLAEKTRTENSEHFPIIQEYIEGEGVGFFALYQEGACKRIFMHRRLRETPASGGASCCAQSIYDKNLMHAGRKILDGLNWNGVAMVEFKRERRTGELFLMEVNPKFWGSLDLAVECGVDFPSLAVKMAKGENIEYSENYRVGLKYHWPLNGEIDHIFDRPTALVPCLLDLCDPRVRSNLWFIDPIPSIHMFYFSAKSIFGRALRKLGLMKWIRRIRFIGLRSTLIRYYMETLGIPIAAYCQVTSCLLVGAQHKRLGLRKLKKLGVTAVVNMRSEFDDRLHGLAVGRYCHIPVDEYTAPTLQQLLQGIEFIADIESEGGVAYIHCREGISRAVTMAAAYLVHKGATTQEAIEMIRFARPFVNILATQKRRLEELEDWLDKNEPISSVS